MGSCVIILQCWNNEYGANARNYPVNVNGTVYNRTGSSPVCVQLQSWWLDCSGTAGNSTGRGNVVVTGIMQPEIHGGHKKSISNPIAAVFLDVTHFELNVQRFIYQTVCFTIAEVSFPLYLCWMMEWHRGYVYYAAAATPFYYSCQFLLFFCGGY